MPAPPAGQPPSRLRIEHQAPAVDSGRWPVKRCAGDLVEVGADVFRDGHDQLRAVVQWKGPGDRRWRESPLTHVDGHHQGVRWEGGFTVDRPGAWQWTVAAWVAPFATWRTELARKAQAGQPDLSGELSEGEVLLRALAARAKGFAKRRLTSAADALTVEVALEPELAELAETHGERHELTHLEPLQALDVDRVRARFGTWYELFPRSFGGLRGVTEQVPRLAELGFDVLYLPPIHPIGTTNRKGRNNALTAEKGDPGSPWAIGGPDGGHTAIHAELGDLADFDALVAACTEHGIDVALDYALQCSPDHPWLTEHPEWFHRRPDGSLKFAENPPKKYQDIYNVNWSSEDWRGLWQACHDAMRFWVDRGVRVFRVDNPHTKALPFWEWLIREIRAVAPDTIFLAEAFTKRAMMQALAKAGFSQSYTYFTWKSANWELEEYVSELAHGPEREFFRPNFFVNTPDILTDELAHGGPAKFASRLLLAATLSPSYGMYSGFEHFEGEQRPGSEEHLDNEKYELKARALDGPLLPFAQRLNEVRAQNPALQHLDNIHFLPTHNDAVMAYAKRTGPNVVICVVNLDPHHAQEGLVEVPYELGVPSSFTVTDLIAPERYDWRVGGNYVRIDPHQRPGHVLRVDTP